MTIVHSQCYLLGFPQLENLHSIFGMIIFVTVPETNPAITRVLSAGGKLFDARLAYPDALLLKL